MDDLPLSPSAKITIERRGQIVLIGINRPYIHNRIDPGQPRVLFGAALVARLRQGIKSEDDRATISSRRDCTTATATIGLDKPDDRALCATAGGHRFPTP
jgi:hypothetical protein